MIAKGNQYLDELKAEAARMTADLAYDDSQIVAGNPYHTFAPFPWAAKGSETSTATWVEDALGKRVCTMKPTDQDWSNCQLLAAAPDLLAALEWLLNAPTEERGFETAITFAAATIAKARGAA